MEFVLAYKNVFNPFFVPRETFLFLVFLATTYIWGFEIHLDTAASYAQFEQNLYEGVWSSKIQMYDKRVSYQSTSKDFKNKNILLGFLFERRQSSSFLVAAVGQ